MDLGTNPIYGKPGAPQSQTTLLIVLLIVVCGVLYWTGAFNGMHPTIPQLGSNTAKINDNMSVATMINTEFGSYAPAAMSIAKCESGLNPNAVNPQKVGNSQATGIFQILYPSTWNTTDYANGSPTDPATNVQAAYQIFHRDGNNWHEWACAKIVGVQ
jgi:hypothetical protein